MSPRREPLPEADGWRPDLDRFSRSRSYHRTGRESYYDRTTFFKQFFYNLLTK